MTRIFAFATVVAAFSGGVAIAADMPVKAPVERAAPIGWEGLYVGVNAGYGWGRVDSLDATFGGVPVASFTPRGGFGGIQAGYNSLLTPRWLFGTEFDFEWGDISGSGLGFRGALAPNPTAISVRYFGTIRERVGFVIDRSLIYATGGVAWAQGSWSSTGGASGIPASIGDDHVRWTIGAGYEYAFAPRWSAKLEYLYANLGQWHVTENFVGSGVRSVDLKLNTIKLGLNYRLDDGAPAATTWAMPVKAHAAPPLSWSGSYIGAHAGYGWGSYNVLNSVAVPADTFALSPKGFLGGFEGGYNWLVTPAWLFGVESDYSFGSLDANGVSAVRHFRPKYRSIISPRYADASATSWDAR
jgi:outer membrane immunogenic protein